MKVRMMPGKVTREQWAYAPALLTLGEVCAWTGLEAHVVHALRDEGKLPVWKRPIRNGRKASYGLYRKTDVERLMW